MNSLVPVVAALVIAVQDVQNVSWRRRFHRLPHKKLQQRENAHEFPKVEDEDVLIFSTKMLLG